MWAKILIKITLVLTPIIILYAALYSMGYYPCLTNSTSFDAKVYELNKIKLQHIDVMVIGSSASLNNINCAGIEKMYHKSCYNFGAWGMQIADIYNIVKNNIDAYKPGYVILVSNFGDFIRAPSKSYNDISIKNIFIPSYYIRSFYNIHDIIDRKKYFQKHTATTNDFESLKYDAFGNVLLDIQSNDVDRSRLELIDNLLKIFPNNYTQPAYERLDDLAKLLKSKHIKLIFIQSPSSSSFIKTQEKQDMIAMHYNKCKYIVEKNNGVYFSYQHNPAIKDSLFADPLHFTHQGANIFTKQLVSDFSNIINN